MKLIITFIPQYLLAEVRNALIDEGISGATVNAVMGYDQSSRFIKLQPGSEYALDFKLNVRLEIAVTEQLLDQTVKAIINTIKSFNEDLPKIIVMHLQESIRIRTGEVGPAAT